jgi:hypothetical protein
MRANCDEYVEHPEDIGLIADMLESEFGDVIERCAQLEEMMGEISMILRKDMTR